MRFVLAFASLAFASSAVAQADPRPDPITVMRGELHAMRAELDRLRAATEAPEVPVHGAIGLDVATHYLFRGIPQEDRGVIVQPSVDLAFGLTGGDGVVRSLDLVLGTWNSLHSGPTGEPTAWYESDVYAGLTAKLGEAWTVGARYIAYHSPNGRFGTVQEIATTASFDDRALGLPLPVPLAPSLTIAFETSGQADAARDLGIYGELGFDPAVDLGEALGGSWRVLFPVRLGFSLGGYYERVSGGGDEAFGYCDVAAVVALALPDLPSAGGGWQLDVGLHWFVLGETNEERNGGDRSELVGSFGVTTTF